VRDRMKAPDLTILDAGGARYATDLYGPIPSS
jgi:hypothetical protein